MTRDFERPRKVHLYTDQRGRMQSYGNKPVDNTRCAGNHGDKNILTTEDPNKVTCRRCLHMMKRDEPVTDLEAALTEQAGHLGAAETKVEALLRRQAKLEDTVRFLLDQLGDARHVVVHITTEFTVGDLAEAVLAARIKE